MIFGNVAVALVACLCSVYANEKAKSGYKIESINSAKINELARKVGGDLGENLGWFANSSSIFQFPGHESLPLKGYYTPSAADKVKGGKKSDQPVIVYLAGWSETTLKYVKFLRVLNSLGYSVFSYDLRGQGFSSPTGYDKGLVTHVSSFSEYVNDLDIFVTKYVRPKIKSADETCAAPAAGGAAGSAAGATTCDGREIIFVGNSMSALMAIKYQIQKPDTFSKMVFISPVLMPTGSTMFTRMAIYVAKTFGFGSKLLLRLPRDISDVKNTHSKEKAKEWIKLREAAPENLIIEGPSVSFVNELTKACEYAMHVAPALTTRMLIIQAGLETFVDNAVMGQFFTSLGGASARLLRLGTSYHEILIERPDIFSEAMEEIARFLSLKSLKGGSKGASSSTWDYLMSFVY